MDRPHGGYTSIHKDNKKAVSQSAHRLSCTAVRVKSKSFLD
ncbi:hypothetical protein HMPREF0294_2013 [Corynebacterium glucuronolyticum ATCC 51867]|uniref:Uncharacterized protein n=1 Tax=Corynebacterium glucuronolyticum ATCC 51866 TaxID=548478 RepID=A0ABP2DTW4_9CORY|nr:hypothetical protein HMPREF0294_2013 [Corynebacterium glucuronolyticum ATCC 51867]EEI62943.1 hypothetical protein HMPREF0293_1461 [Corynebacterium glucuronolyticum ATCC 51866]